MGTLGCLCGDLGLWDARGGKWGCIGCREVGDVGISNIGDPRGKARRKFNISFFVKMCYLCSTLDSILQNHIEHLMMFTKDIYIGVSALTIFIRVNHC